MSSRFVAAPAALPVRRELQRRCELGRLRTRLAELERAQHLVRASAEIEREILRRYLAAYPTKKAAAQALGIGLRTLHAKVKHHQLERRPRRRTTA